MITYLRSNK